MATREQKKERLYELLPAVYRERDAAEKYPLRALLGLIQEQANIIGADIEKLWDNFFIETCERWVVPYIGDLVSNNLLHDAGRITDPDTAIVLFPDLTGRNLRPEIAIRTRADVAKTIYHRRRKGTPAMLEELARDVTGWQAHAVEFFQILGWTQNLNHLRLFNHDCLELRRIEPVDRLNGPFDTASHTVDVRAIRQCEGWYNIRNIGFFLWRLKSYPLENVPARQGSVPWQYHFSPLGNPAPFFNRCRREGDESGLTTEIHVPGPIRPAYFFDDLERYKLQEPPRLNKTDLYASFDDEGSFYLKRNGVSVAPAIDPDASTSSFQPQIVSQLLSPWPSTQPSGKIIAVDVEHGRLAVGDGWKDETEQIEQIDTSYHYGFSADMGGGPYDRKKWLVKPGLADLHYWVKEDGIVPPGADQATYYNSLVGALTAWEKATCPNAVITILDNRTYELPEKITLNNEGRLVIEAANGLRPLVQSLNTSLCLEIQVMPDDPDNAGHRAELTLSGVVVEGFIQVTGDLDRLRLLHTTLIPGRQLGEEDGKPATNEPSLIVDGGTSVDPINTRLRVEAAFSICGPLRLPAHAEGVWLLDSIVDGLEGVDGSKGMAIANTEGDGFGPPATLERVTIFGKSEFKRLPLASEVIFTDTVNTELVQEGCVRFSYVAPDSQTPRRYRCQPCLEIKKQIDEEEKKALAEGVVYTATQWQDIKDAIRGKITGWLVPHFTASQYGLPGYAQLRLCSPVQIRTGAGDGSEMGAFSHLKQPQKETNLRIRLEEYLPFGLEAGLIYVT